MRKKVQGIENQKTHLHCCFSTSLVAALSSLARSRFLLHGSLRVLLGVTRTPLPQKRRAKSTVEREKEKKAKSLIARASLSPLSFFFSIGAPSLFSRAPFLSGDHKRESRPGQPPWRSSPLLPRRRPSSTPWTPPTTPTLRPGRRRIVLPRPLPPKPRATSTRASRPCSASSSSTRSR